jgi:hypothetical protein
MDGRIFPREKVNAVLLRCGELIRSSTGIEDAVKAAHFTDWAQ